MFTYVYVSENNALSEYKFAEGAERFPALANTLEPNVDFLLKASFSKGFSKEVGKRTTSENSPSKVLAPPL